MSITHPINATRQQQGIHSFLRFLVILLPLLFIGMQARPAHAATINVAAGGDFQAALNSAQPGDTIVLAAGATYTGAYTLPNKSGSAYITVQSSALSSLPAAGTRVSPANAPWMPKIVAPSYQAALQTSAGAHHFRFIGIEFTVVSADTTVYNLIELGTDQQTQQSQVPHHLTFDRCYVHAHQNQSSVGWVRNGFVLNASNVQIVESYISEFRLTDNEGHGIVGWNGPGPFSIINNFIEASGINVLFGGAWAQTGMNPADLEFRRNKVSKRPEWRGIYSVKNLFELKDMRRATVDGNLFEYNWAHAQPGYAILFTPASLQSGPDARIEDIQFTNNIVRHSANAIDMTGRDYGDPNYPNIPVQNNRITIKNNLFDDIGGTWGDGRFLLLTSGGGPDDLTVDHNTIIHTGSVLLLDAGPQARLVFNNNLMAHNAYGVIGVGSMGGGIGNAALNVYCPGNTFRRNLIAGANASQYPTDNFYPASLSAAGFTDSASGNYRLAASSPYRNAGTDNKDVGCDFDALTAAMNGGPGPQPTPTPTPTATPTPTPTATPTATPTPQPVGALVDDFNDNAFDPAKWIYNTIQGAIYTGPTAWDATVPVLERNQRLEISPRLNVTGDHYNGYVFANGWNLTNARAGVEVIQTTGGTADTNLAVCLDSRNFYMISVENGQLRFEQVVNGSRTSTVIAYSSTQHRFWRIRHDPTADAIVFETSPDGQTWTAQRTVARQLAITVMRAEISAGTWQALAAPGTAVFDNFKLEPNNTALVAPPLVASARQLALTLGGQLNPDDASILTLVNNITQAYTAFLNESSRYSASAGIQRDLRNALGSANAAHLSPRPAVRKRLLIAADYLGSALTQMQSTGARQVLTPTPGSRGR
ncbi:MAG: hypothetical protein JOZ52_02660 [Acidobacteria bacterium]|nr:hypothetical protein [Acidobacteriota bacterium]